MGRVAAALTVLSCITACSGDGSPGLPLSAGTSFDFRQGPQQWAAGFVDYPPGQEAFYELDAGYRPLPAEVGAGSGLYIAGNNHSDDLFMYYKRRLAGLVPGREYRVRFDEVEFASEAPGGCPGAGGSAGDSVVVKGGASTVEPVAVVDAGNYRLNVDKGNQSTEGAAALVLGSIANSRDCSAPLQFVLKSLDSGDRTISVNADAAGALWIFVGTESGFEATTRLYYTRVVVTLL